MILEFFFCFFTPSCDKKKDKGSIYSVGENYLSKLGDGTNTNSSNIKKILYFKDMEIIEINSNEKHCLALNNKGELYEWGCVKKKLLSETNSVVSYLPKILCKIKL